MSGNLKYVLWSKAFQDALQTLGSRTNKATIFEKTHLVLASHVVSTKNALCEKKFSRNNIQIKGLDIKCDESNI